jgi:hypothetical protein
MAVIATIDQLDHSGKTARLAPEGGVLAQELCARVMARRGAPDQRPADRAVTGEGEELELAGVHLQLLYPGPTARVAGWRVTGFVTPLASVIVRVRVAASVSAAKASRKID